MSTLLVKWDDNWADEMDVMGFALMSQSEWDNYVAKVSAKEDIHVCFGTNEEIHYDNGKELLKTLETTLLSQEEEAVIRKLFGDEYGHTQFMYVTGDY